MLCPICGCAFCDDTADLILLGQARKRFCSSKCSRIARRRREKAHAARKVHFRTEQEARSRLKVLNWFKTAPNPGAYWCCERGWLLTSDMRTDVLNIRNKPGRKIAWTAKKSQPLNNSVIPAGIAEKLFAQLGDSEP